MSAAVELTAQAQLVTVPHQVRSISAYLRYQCDDPLAVRIAFPPEASLDGTEVEWVFARDLLESGVHRPSGEGDVRLWPSGTSRVMLEFHSCQGMALVELRTGDVRRFLSHTVALLPPGQERTRLRLDQGLAELLGRV